MTALLGVITSAWILLMAWKLWHAEPMKALDTDKPFTFVQAILFQWVNPKIWAVATSVSVMLADLASSVDDCPDGTHQELLALGGQYAGFWERQSGGFISTEIEGEA